MNNVTVRIQKKYRDSVRMRLFVFGTLAGLLVIASAFSRYLTPYDPYLQDLSNVKAAPSALHLLGTDRYGRDMLSRVIAGSRASVFSTLLLVSVITVVGTAVGILCGWRGDFTDTFFMRISDVFLAFPGLVFALAVAGSFGGGLHNAIIALAVISWPKYARIARSQTLARKETTWMRAVKHFRQRNVQDYSETSSAEYHGAGTGDFHAGHRNHDDGTGGAEFSGTGGQTSGSGMGQHDE